MPPVVEFMYSLRKVRVVASVGRQVKAGAMKLAGEIAECSPLGLLSTRATMRANLADRVMAATNHELAEQTRLRATEDFKEGVKATEERRTANFKGR